MDKLKLTDLVDIAAYEKDRAARLDAVIALKKRRRIALGPMITLVFENRDTLKSQIQEMMRAERLVQESAILAELEVYNDLIPAENELSATLFIEVDDPARVRSVLDRFIGLDEGERLQMRFDAGMSVPARFETGHSRDDRISAVHFVKFPLDATAAAAFRSGNGRVELVVSHPHYEATADIACEVRTALAEDLRPHELAS